MTCRNTDLIFDLRREITELTAANAGLETAIREHAALATGEIERLKAVPPVPRYTSEMGDAAERYLQRRGFNISRLPGSFRWQVLWDVMLSASTDPEHGEDPES